MREHGARRTKLRHTHRPSEREFYCSLAPRDAGNTLASGLSHSGAAAIYQYTALGQAQVRQVAWCVAVGDDGEVLMPRP